jgi:hypothetical protein
VVEDEIRDWVMDEMCGVVSLHSWHINSTCD